MVWSISYQIPCQVGNEHRPKDPGPAAIWIGMKILSGYLHCISFYQALIAFMAINIKTVCSFVHFLGANYVFWFGAMDDCYGSTSLVGLLLEIQKMGIKI